jgi:hypothetical protein
VTKLHKRLSLKEVADAADWKTARSTSYLHSIRALAAVFLLLKPNLYGNSWPNTKSTLSPRTLRSEGLPSLQRVRDDCIASRATGGDKSEARDPTSKVLNMSFQIGCCCIVGELNGCPLIISATY